MPPTLRPTASSAFATSTSTVGILWHTLIAGELTTYSDSPIRSLDRVYSHPLSVLFPRLFGIAPAIFFLRNIIARLESTRHSRASGIRHFDACLPREGWLTRDDSGRPLRNSHQLADLLRQYFIDSETLDELAFEPTGVFNPALLHEDRNSKDKQVGRGEPDHLLYISIP
jgi:hypothetical protein